MKMTDSMQPKRLNINNNIDQSKTVLDSNEISNLLCMYSAILFFYTVRCKTPVEPQHGFIVDYCNLATTEGSVITFQCDPAFSPAAEMTATCNSSGQWSTDPSQLVCTSNGERWKMSLISVCTWHWNACKFY